jgi:sterol desaturase/sphingolipid hydroxylase (fatty acid hydroxylase superfamily)
MLAGSPRISRGWQAAFIASVFVGLTIAETVRALRQQREAKPLHIGRNLAVAASAGIVMNVIEEPLVALLTGHRVFSLWRGIASILLLDYTLYVWHVLTHRLPFLWRFHLPHHVDLDLDASTALRFHFGEMMLAVPYRLLQVTLFGVDYRTYSIWQTFLFACILFHHSNLRLPLGVERKLAWVLMTPRLHGIHHDADYAHLNSNWSSGLSIWDRLHGTFRDDVPQEQVSIGVPGHVRKDSLRRALSMPFHAVEL